MMLARASRLNRLPTPLGRRRSISAAACMLSSMDCASSLVAGAKPEGDVFQHFHEDAAEPEGHEFSEARVRDRAHDHFQTILPVTMLLNLNARSMLGPRPLYALALPIDAFVRRLRQLRSPPRRSVRPRLPSYAGCLRRDDLHDHGVADVLGEVRRSLRGQTEQALHCGSGTRRKRRSTVAAFQERSERSRPSDFTLVQYRSDVTSRRLLMYDLRLQPWPSGGLLLNPLASS